ncbi:hypothetical protein ACOMHN_061616 [Nucella lapillus]
MATAGGAGGAEGIRPLIAELQNTRQAKFTDCPKCGLLILGPCLLDCGHVLCRKCLRKVLQDSARPRCPECDNFLRSLPEDNDLSVAQLIHMAVCQEPVLQCLVDEELDKHDDIRCLNCPQTTYKAVKVCLDCQEYMCEECSQRHLNSQDEGKDHLFQILPGQGEASSQSSPTTSSEQAGLSTTTITTTDASRDQPRDDDQSRDREPKEFMGRQLAMLREACNEKEEQSKVLQNIVGIAQRLFEEERVRGRRLRSYQQALMQLSSLNLDEIDPATHTVEFEGSQITVQELKTLGEGITESPNADILLALSTMLFGENKN